MVELLGIIAKTPLYEIHEIAENDRRFISFISKKDERRPLLIEDKDGDVTKKLMLFNAELEMRLYQLGKGKMPKIEMTEDKVIVYFGEKSETVYKERKRTYVWKFLFRYNLKFRVIEKLSSQRNIVALEINGDDYVRGIRKILRGKSRS